MADTLANTTLPANTWVDLYADTGISVGTKISVQNIGSNTIKLSTKLTTPISSDGFAELTPGNDQFDNDAGDSGAWAFSPIVIGLIQVRVFT